MNAALYYHPEAYTTAGPKLMGRNAAGESFLRGYFAHSRASTLWVQTEQTAHAEHFAQAARQAGRSEPVRAVVKNQAGGLAGLAHAGTVYLPGPGLGEWASPRAFYGHAAWSLCGITHTTSSARAMDAIAELITAPVQPWDALICTSTAVHDNVQRVLQAQADALQARLGIQRLMLPQLPVIPLGIHTQDFQFTPAQRQAARASLQLDEHTRVVLFMGRLSFHAKAHPLAQYQALQQAAQRSGQRVVLIECGWHANDFITKAYADAARLACPDVPVITLDGRKPQDRLTAWAAADIFCSLSDNIQETFGITPIEAMAAGLPVVVSDWDGYKDTVRHGVDGWRVPTLMPQAGLGGDLALRHALELDTYDMYCGHTCSLVAVDVQATAQAFESLLASPERCAQMGAAGRERARAQFDWAAIIPRYESLWGDLAQRRAAAADTPAARPSAQPWPARMDPFQAFAAYPTLRLEPHTPLRRTHHNLDEAEDQVRRMRALAMVDFARLVLPSEAEVQAVLTAASTTAQPAVDLLHNIPEERRAAVFRALAWLVKLGVLATAEGPSGVV